MNWLEEIGFDRWHAIHVNSFEEVKLIVNFAKEHGITDDCVEDEDDWFSYPYIVIEDNCAEMNAFHDTSDIGSFIEFDEWSEQYLGYNPNDTNLKVDLDLDSLSELL